MARYKVSDTYKKLNNIKEPTQTEILFDKTIQFVIALNVGIAIVGFLVLVIVRSVTNV